MMVFKKGNSRGWATHGLPMVDWVGRLSTKFASNDDLSVRIPTSAVSLAKDLVF